MAIAGARPLLGLSPARVALAGAIPAGAAVAAHVVMGGYAGPGASGGDASRLLGLLAIVGAGVAAWAAVLRMLPGSSRVPRERRAGGGGRDAGPGRGSGRAAAAAGVGLALAAAVALAGLAAFSTDTEAPGVEPVSGFDHGRAEEWGVAVDAALERPLVGAGADAYALAAAEQGGGTTLYAHSLPLESWAELGPLGLALVVALYASTGALIWRLRGDPRAWLVAPAVAVFLLANLVDWPWHLAGAGAVWAAALGALLALDVERRERA